MRANSATSNVVTFLVASALLMLAPLAAPSALTGSGLVSGAAAQSDEFDDEFDDEFEDRQREEPSRGTGGGSRGRSLADDLAEEDDEFGGGGDDGDRDDGERDEAIDDDGERDEAEPARDAEPAPREGRATDARGDLLNTNGSRAWRQRRFVLHNTYGGPVGGLHIVDAGSGPSQTFRVGLLTDFWFANRFFDQSERAPEDPQDENAHIGGALSLSYTPFDFLEIYGSIRSYANSNPIESPALFQVLGDSTLGVKAFYEVVPWLTLGGDIGIHLLNTVGDIGLVGDSTSLSFRVNAAADLRAVEGVEFPLIARLNLAYFYDRSSVLTDQVERARYDALPTVGPDARRRCYDESGECDEDRHLLTRVERFALNINRTDFFDIGLGLEMPIFAMENFYVSPIVEWNVRVPVNSRSYSCLWIPAEPGGRTPVPGQDGCLEFQGFAAMPSTLTLGVRVQPPIRGLGITFAVDIGTSGQTFVRELSGTAPYNVFLGLSYAYDTVPPPAEVIEREVERRVEVRIPPPVRGRLVGTVIERGTTTGIGNAIITFAGSDLTALSTGGDGRFTTYEMAPGQVRMSISHPEYNSADCQGTIPRRAATSPSAARSRRSRGSASSAVA